MKNTHFGLLIIRVTIGLLMLPHGINKLVHPEALVYITHLLEQRGLPSAISYGVFIGEIIAPFFVLIGLRTRLSALVMVTTEFMVLFLAYSDNIFSLTEHGGWSVELPALFLFPALAVVIMGGGKYAISTKSKWD
jgi:doxX family protein